MKYLGKKSLSSFVSKLLNISWYALLILFIAGLMAGVSITIYSLTEGYAGSGICADYSFFQKDSEDITWMDTLKIPFLIKLLFLIYFSVLMVLMLKIIRNAQHLFTNFMNDIVFSYNNVHLMARISKILIIFSILTFNISSIIVSLLLLLLCEIFKNGTALQEEHDLTI